MEVRRCRRSTAPDQNDPAPELIEKVALAKLTWKNLHYMLQCKGFSVAPIDSTPMVANATDFSCEDIPTGGVGIDWLSYLGAGAVLTIPCGFVAWLVGFGPFAEKVKYKDDIEMADL
mmetsp:Transcript_11378/g.25083  ORF Transcript_11378/g.25083 Transcript_11378/m.25083 type:complete len:117 (+) Transcript_11378:554-904(+)